MGDMDVPPGSSKNLRVQQNMWLFQGGNAFA